MQYVCQAGSQTYLQSELSVTAPRLKSNSLVKIKMTCNRKRRVLLCNSDKKKNNFSSDTVQCIHLGVNNTGFFEFVFLVLLV